MVSEGDSANHPMASALRGWGSMTMTTGHVLGISKGSTTWVNSTRSALVHPGHVPLTGNTTLAHRKHHVCSWGVKSLYTTPPRWMNSPCRRGRGRPAGEGGGGGVRGSTRGPPVV